MIETGPGLKIVEPQCKHMAFREALVKTIQAHSNLTTGEIIAILSYTVGQAIAILDQTKITPVMAIDLVMNNIELGNTHAINDLKEARAHGNA